MSATFKFASLLCSCVALSGCMSEQGSRAGGTLSPLPQTGDSYFVSAQKTAAQKPSDARARNVILFVGDGMGITTVTAARIYAGQKLGMGAKAESYELAMDTFPHTAFSRTYSDDMQISESASTATAMTTGVKTRGGGLGLTAAATEGTCAEVEGAMAKSLFEIAEEAGKATGVVTTTRITHATPGSTYAHVPSRNWENDVMLEKGNGAPCKDIALQLIEWPAGDGLEVAFGGGRGNFLPKVEGEKDPLLLGARGDGRDLTAQWTQKPGRVYVRNTGELAALDPKSNAQVLGLFSPDHMAYDFERDKTAAGEPSLAEMTKAAIRRVSQNANGYVLMVEGGRIDHGHHDGHAGWALSETVAMDDAVRAALDMTDRSDTLIVVTADHSHTLTIAGYAQRGTPILGLSTTEKGLAKARDGLPYTTLSYANGPGSIFPAEGKTAKRARPDLTKVDTTDMNFRQQSLVPGGEYEETHGGEDVPIYAWGPGDENFAGSLEQNVIFHLLRRALALD